MNSYLGRPTHPPPHEIAETRQDTTARSKGCTFSSFLIVSSPPLPTYALSCPCASTPLSQSLVRFHGTRGGDEVLALPVSGCSMPPAPSRLRLVPASRVHPKSLTHPTTVRYASSECLVLPRTLRRQLTARCTGASARRQRGACPRHQRACVPAYLQLERTHLRADAKPPRHRRPEPSSSAARGSRP